MVHEDAPAALPVGMRVGLSTFIMGASLVCTACVDDVSVVWGLLGSTCGILLSYILPAASYLLLRRTPKAATRHASDSVPGATVTLSRQASSVPRRKLAALALVAVGLVLIPLCLSQSIRSLREREMGSPM